MVPRLFGTDGIRGRVVAVQQDESKALAALHEQRVICTSLLRLVGEALGRTMDTLPGRGTTVVVGWDDRPNNLELSGALTLGLRLTGCHVIHIGLCATPALHRATLLHGARMGCMITASHNPVSDSGLKVFDSNGFKSSPMYEDHVSLVADSLAAEEREIDQIESSELSQPSEPFVANPEMHGEWLAERFLHLQSLIGPRAFATTGIAQPFLLDSSRGAAHSWLAAWLPQRGISTVEVSEQAEALNFNCGAGDFSPTQTWTFLQAADSPHLLLQHLQPAPAGTIVGAALDGDGDRCLLIRATDSGFMVVDGDALGDTILSAATRFNEAPWHLAASIESDLSLLSTVGRLPASISVHETAVGDRWLSKALAPNLRASSEPPRCIGVEDSGHIVMATAHPSVENGWALVGDGAATLVAYLLALSATESGPQMQRGWKQRQSVKDVDRTLWTGKNQLADEIETMAKSFFSQHCEVGSWNRHGLEGEPNLMLISFTLDGSPASLGVRNSGTQAKISVSLRLSPEIDSTSMDDAIHQITSHLAKTMRQ